MILIGQTSSILQTSNGRFTSGVSTRPSSAKMRNSRQCTRVVPLAKRPRGAGSLPYRASTSQEETPSNEGGRSRIWESKSRITGQRHNIVPQPSLRWVILGVFSVLSAEAMHWLLCGWRRELERISPTNFTVSRDTGRRVTRQGAHIQRQVRMHWGSGRLGLLCSWDTEVSTVLDGEHARATVPCARGSGVTPTDGPSPKLPFRKKPSSTKSRTDCATIFSGPPNDSESVREDWSGAGQQAPLSQV